MSQLRTRTLAAVLAAVVLLAPVAGCGGGDGNDGSDSSDSSSKKPASKKTEDVAAFVEKLTDAMARKRTAKLDIELGSSLAATADVEYADSGTSMALKMNLASQTHRVVLVGGAMSLQPTQGSKYLHHDKNDPALGSLIGQLSSIGPKSALDNVKAGVKKVDDRGTQTVDGETLNRYQLTVDTAKVSTLFGVPKGTADTPKTLIYDIWVDDDYLLRQVKMTVSGQTLVMKATDWGKPVTITVPPASQVTTR
jgi:hypothetical protein